MSGSTLVPLSLFTPDVLADVQQDANNLYLVKASGEQVTLSLAALKAANHSKNNNSARTTFTSPATDNSTITADQLANMSVAFSCTDTDGKIMGAAWKLDDGDFTDLGITNVQTFSKVVQLPNIMPGGHRFFVKLIDNAGLEVTSSIAWFNEG